MNIQKTVKISLLLLPLAFADYALAGQHEHGHQDETQHHNEDAIKKGPHGGKLLQQDDISVEVTIFETDVPPEMRLYLYQDGKQIMPNAETQVQVLLERLGGVQDRLTFNQELDYLVSQQTVIEPHSYDVTVKANINKQQAHWHFQSHEGRSVIATRMLETSGIVSESITAQTLKIKKTLFGVIEPAQNNIYRINAPYKSLVKNIFVSEGQQVKKGDKLIALYNTQTLKTYTVTSPAKGEVGNISVRKGDKAELQTLLEVTDLSQVWVEMSAFPEAIEQLKLGQSVEVYDMHGHDRAYGELIYIAPQMTGGHIARARTLIDNPQGHWRPGMHIKADIIIQQKNVPMAVKNSAIQSFRDMQVVFAEFDSRDENNQIDASSKTYEVRMLDLGETDGTYSEVLGGINKTDRYVSENSYLIKADVLKDGASHDH